MRQAIFLRARDIAVAQGGLGDSPAQLSDDGRVALCAASCVALAALAVRGDACASADFQTRIWTDSKEVLLPEIFEESGLSAETALELVKENDSRPSIDRLPWFVSRMEELALVGK